MSRAELLQLMAAQIFADMAPSAVLGVPGKNIIDVRAEAAVKAAKAIAKAVEQSPV
jgi:hypothetical protein